MHVTFTKSAYKDYVYWEVHNPRLHKKINTLLCTIAVTPYSGIGKPEPLKFDLQGYYSRRIDREHRLVYTVHMNEIIVLSCRYHYE